MLATIDRFLTPARALVGASALLAIYLITTVLWVATTHHLMDVFHQPLGGDFIIFYSASDLTLHGHAAAVFDPHALLAVERAIVPGVRPGLEWCYPPTFQLLIAPLALVPFPLSYGLFVAVTLAPFLLLMQAFVPGRASLALSCAFPGTFVNAWQGQNGFLTTSLMGGGLMLLDRRPWLAGALLGLLVIKPQFGILLPLLLVGTGRWKSTLAAAASAAALMTVSFLLMGAGPWLGFLRTMPQVSAALTTGSLPYAKMASVFVTARWLGASVAGAWTMQILAAGVVAAATLWAWRRPAPLALKAGLAVLATFLVSPYSFNYDLVLLAVPIAATLAHARRHGLPAGTKAALLLAAFTPTLFLGFAKLTHVQLMPAAILICYAAFLRIAWVGRVEDAPAADCTGAQGALV